MSNTGNPYVGDSDRGSSGAGGALIFSVVAGGASATRLDVVTPHLMHAEDQIVSVIEYASGVPSDVTANVTAIVASGFKLSSVSSGDTLVVTWLDRQLPR